MRISNGLKDVERMRCLLLIAPTLPISVFINRRHQLRRKPHDFISRAHPLSRRASGHQIVAQYLTIASHRYAQTTYSQNIHNLLQLVENKIKGNPR
mgnify:CR=1 FL=1